MSTPMKSLEPPDTHYLSAALGWLELGNRAETRTELASISAEGQKHPDVLEARWALWSAEENWPEALRVARELVERAPDRASGWVFRAYALRRVPEGGLQPAWEALLPASEQFAQETIVAFNLACYACQMRQLETARKWLQRAARIGGKLTIQRMALAEPDLEPLWPEIRGWAES